MPCRLCHKKIPFFRSWFTVAEFCCDEHEKEYKDLMVTRLAASVDIEPAPAAKPLLPEWSEPEPESAAEPDAAAEEQAAIMSDESPPDPAEVSEDDAEELWRLADEVGSLADKSRPPATTAGKPQSGVHAPKPEARRRHRGKRSRGETGT